MNVVYICGPGEQEVVNRRIDARWCFACRRRVVYIIEMLLPIDPEMLVWGETFTHRCASCGAHDRDLFPVTDRYW